MSASQRETPFHFFEKTARSDSGVGQATRIDPRTVVVVRSVIRDACRPPMHNIEMLIGSVKPFYRPYLGVCYLNPFMGEWESCLEMLYMLERHPQLSILTFFTCRKRRMGTLKTWGYR